MGDPASRLRDRARACRIARQDPSRYHEIAVEGWSSPLAPTQRGGGQRWPKRGRTLHSPLAARHAG